MTVAAQLNQVTFDSASQYLAEPATMRSELGSTMGNILDGIRNVAQPIAATIGGVLGSDTFDGAWALLEMQRQMQAEALEINTVSNIEKTKYEAAMAPARNIRTS